MLYTYVLFFFFKQKTAYEVRISDWSSDVCSSDLNTTFRGPADLSAGPFLLRDRQSSALSKRKGFRKNARYRSQLPPAARAYLFRSRGFRRRRIHGGFNASRTLTQAQSCAATLPVPPQAPQQSPDRKTAGKENKGQVRV